MSDTVKLTKPQREELVRLAHKRQHTYGCHRARVQSNLVRLGLADWCEEDGSPAKPRSIYQLLASYGTPYPLCEITDAGRAALKPQPRPGGDQ